MSSGGEPKQSEDGSHRHHEVNLKERLNKRASICWLREKAERSPNNRINLTCYSGSFGTAAHFRSKRARCNTPVIQALGPEGDYVSQR